MKRILLTILSIAFLSAACGETKQSNPEPVGDNRKHYDWLMQECDINEKLIEESGYTKSASQLGRRNYCTEAEEMRERITGILDSNAPGAKNF
jgi:hypothetical protein